MKKRFGTMALVSLAVMSLAFALSRMTAVSGDARAAGAKAASPAGEAAGRDAARDGSTDFDFLVGSWKVKNRRLSKFLSGATDWQEFEALSVSRPILGGKGNVEELEGDAPNGHMHGVSVRLYDATTKRWRDYWGTTKSGAFEAPSVGSFKDGRGEFFIESTFEGKPIVERYVWSNITRDSCRWEQAFSADGGKTWEVNWTMEFTRTNPSLGGRVGGDARAVRNRGA